MKCDRRSFVGVCPIAFSVAPVFGYWIRQSARTASSDWQNQANDEGGGGQHEGSNGHHPKRGCGYCTADLGAESFSPAKLHSQHPDDGPDGDQDQGNDRLIAGQRPESPESHSDGNCYGETRSAPCEFGTLTSEAGVPQTAFVLRVGCMQGLGRLYFEPMRARTTAMTATNPMPMESTSGIGERGNGKPRRIAFSLALQ